MTEPSPDSGWSRQVKIVDCAVIYPPGISSQPSACGVWGPDGDVSEAAVWREGRRQTDPAQEAPKPEARLEGRYLWGGMYYGHFGHFIVEAISRLWALKDHKVKGILFLSKHEAHVGVRGYQQDLIELIGVDVPTMLVRDVTEVEELVIPGQGFGLGEISKGTPEFHQMMDGLRDKIKPKGHKNIYISRTQFHGRGGILNEPLLEKNLKRSGYRIVHPQRLPIEEQLALYAAADNIISLDNSALHLLGFVARPDQNVAIITRRNAPAFTHIARQLESKMGHSPLVVNSLLADWMTENQKIPNHISWGELDYKDLEKKLADGGFIASEPHWQHPEDPLPQDIIKGAEEISKKPLVRRETKRIFETVGGRPGGATNAPAVKEETPVSTPAVETSKTDNAMKPENEVKIMGVCRFSMMGRGDWKAFKGKSDDELEGIYKEQEKMLFDPKRIEDRLDTFEHLTLSSLAAQSEKNFKFLVVTSDRMPKKYMKRLEDMCSKVEQVILKPVEPSHISQVIKDNFEDMDVPMSDYIQFRLDDDDCVSIDFMRRAHMHARCMWEHQNFSMSFAQQYYCVTDGPTEGVYNWYSPFFSAGAFVRHKHRTIFDFGHYNIPKRLLAVVDAHFPNIVTHRGDNDTPRHDAKVLKKRGMYIAEKDELKRVHERHFQYLSKKGLKLCGFDQRL